MYIVHNFISLTGNSYAQLFLKVFINWKCFFIESNLINQSKAMFLNACACNCLIKNDITTFKWQLIIFLYFKTDYPSSNRLVVLEYTKIEQRHNPYSGWCPRQSSQKRVCRNWSSECMWARNSCFLDNEIQWNRK
jgi:hypothetical protein